MTTATFDANDHIQYLVRTGDFTEKQAEAIVSADARKREAERQGEDGLVTKRDLSLILKAALAEQKFDLLKWYFAGLLALFAALFAGLSSMMYAMLRAFLSTPIGV